MSYFIVPPVFGVPGFFREFEARMPRRLDDIGNCEFEKDEKDTIILHYKKQPLPEHILFSHLASTLESPLSSHILLMYKFRFDACTD